MNASEVAALDQCVAHTGDAGRIEMVAESLLSVDDATDVSAMFKLLGDPTRVRILFALLEGGELCVCDIAEIVDTTDTKVSQAMRLLRAAGVVRNRRDGRNIFYRLDDTTSGCCLSCHESTSTIFPTRASTAPFGGTCLYVG